ncbi:TetR family transcriptional regulator [Nocardiopsis baichengensis]|uniref:TetR family transcriptional regulator n=1 Tax=Nocardiopsis baichengensis TaxID=280240 RepID=UPI0003467B5D|nr:TetR family transcriptional regulator [Nocardiopsis baichengensis]
MPSTGPLREEGEDLRARRRRQTAEHVGQAALRLFEERGVAATTVDDIAAASGISPRTFFRYFPTKEDAALQDFSAMEEAIEALDLAGADAAGARERIEEMYAVLIARLTAEPQARRYAAVQRLTAREPALKQAAEARLQAYSDRLCARLTEALGPGSRLKARVIAALTGAVLHAALTEWGQEAEGGGPQDLAALYREAREFLAGVLPERPSRA